jgi:hypothetical protein
VKSSASTVWGNRAIALGDDIELANAEKWRPTL